MSPDEPKRHRAIRRLFIYLDSGRPRLQSRPLPGLTSMEVVRIVKQQFNDQRTTDMRELARQIVNQIQSQGETDV